jgi:hypothetical protein
VPTRTGSTGTVSLSTTTRRRKAQGHTRPARLRSRRGRASTGRSRRLPPRSGAQPANSCPKAVPTRVSDIMPWYRRRSEPQTEARSPFTIALFGCSIARTGVGRLHVTHRPPPPSVEHSSAVLPRSGCRTRSGLDAGVPGEPASDGAFGMCGGHEAATRVMHATGDPGSQGQPYAHGPFDRPGQCP